MVRILRLSHHSDRCVGVVGVWIAEEEIKRSGYTDVTFVDMFPNTVPCGDRGDVGQPKTKAENICELIDEFMARMIQKYGKEVLAEIKAEEAAEKE